jgi:cobalt-zinc-cadmium efflux system outer membrane protein
VKPFLLLFLIACACASVSPKGSFDDVSKLVAERGGGPIHWDQGTPADEQVQARVRDLVKGTLTAEGAVEVALLRNQGLVATYEKLGIAQADLVQAGLLRNPSFGARVRFPTSGPGTFIDTEFSLVQDFLDLFTFPLRKRVAAAQLDATKARVGGAVLDLTVQVRQAVVSLQAAQATVEVRKLVLEAQSAAAELRARQRAVGNVGDLDLFQEQAFFEQSKLDLARVEQQAVEQREQVNRLLGLWGPESATWKVESRLPDVPEQDPSLDQVESLAIGRRLDLIAIRAEAQALEQAASLAGVTRAVPALQAGVSVATRKGPASSGLRSRSSCPSSIRGSRGRRAFRPRSGKPARVRPSLRSTSGPRCGPCEAGWSRRTDRPTSTAPSSCLCGRSP